MNHSFEPKALVWVGSSRRDIKALPKSVQRVFGVALFAVQCGERPRIARPLKGFGGGVLELTDDDRAGTYRTVYTVRMRTAIFVLHVFQKKSHRGLATPLPEIELIRRRLKTAEEIAVELDRELLMKNEDFEVSGGNVFADMGFRDADQELLKARLTVEIHRLIKARKLTQARAASLLGTTQPQVSALMRCKPASVSVGRLMGFLTALGQDVEVKVRAAVAAEAKGRISVDAASVGLS